MYVAAYIAMTARSRAFLTTCLFGRAFAIAFVLEVGFLFCLGTLAIIGKLHCLIRGANQVYGDW